MFKMIKSPVAVLVCLFFVFCFKFFMSDKANERQVETVNTVNSVNVNVGVTTSLNGSAIAGEMAGTTAEVKKDEKVEEVKEEPKYDFQKIFPPISKMLEEKSFGKKDAPVVIKVFSAYTCGHCGNFFIDTVPEIMEKEIKEGKVRIIFEDYPTNAAAVKATLIAKCSNPENYMKVSAKIYKNATKLYNRGEFEQAMEKAEDITGLNKEKIEACLSYEALREKLKEKVIERAKAYTFDSTPTLIYEKSIRKYQEAGAVPYARVHEIVEKLLKNEDPAK